MKLLIANRGEIACRIARTAARLGIPTVAVYADPDRQAPHVGAATEAVRIGPGELARSYLSVDAILDAARRTRASAVHPGYGFLSERADFAEAVVDAGLTWVGPHAQAIRRMGSKIEARRLAEEVGVPVIPGSAATPAAADLTRAAGSIGFPVLIKASAGGGGKGIRVVRHPRDLAPALRGAAAEAARSFGDPSVIVERYLERSRHVEVQVVGDHHGNVIELGTRECSLQRRYQKVVEEAPAPHLAGPTEAGLRAAAVTLARSIGYDSVGTVEFIVDAESGAFFFLEMNTRLQVEHPVTEYVTAVDLVELQLRSAHGEPLPLGQGDVAVRGHAIEARVNAEDPWAGFIPQVGRVTGLVVPEGVRWDAGVEPGTEVSVHYDPLLGKVIAGGGDRETARRRLVAALGDLQVAGVRTNVGFLRWLLARPEVVAGTVTTGFLERCGVPPAPAAGRAARIAAAHLLRARDDQLAPLGVWGALGPYRLTPHRRPRSVTLDDGDERHQVAATGFGGRYQIDGHTIEVGSQPPGRPALMEDGARSAVPVRLDHASVHVTVEGVTHTFRVVDPDELAGGDDGRGDGTGAVTAPFPSVVAEVDVRPGEAVAGGQVLVVLEAMKMLHSLTAPWAATVAEVRVAPGAQVEGGTVLVTFEPDQ